MCAFFHCRRLGQPQRKTKEMLERSWQPDMSWVTTLFPPHARDSRSNCSKHPHGGRIRDVVGVDTDLFTPPAGEYDERVLEVAAELGYRTVMYSLDTADWLRQGEICARCPARRERKIILLHPTERAPPA